jgi:hypothetical protein
MLDHSAETLTLLDQSSQDIHPVEDFNGAPYPSFAQVCILEVPSVIRHLTKCLVECSGDPGYPDQDGT